MNAAPMTIEEWDYFARLAAEVVGGLDELEKRPLISGTALVTPPLTLGISACYTLLGATKYNLPLLVGGANAPTTILNACQVVLHYASNLGTLTLAQMINPGTPCVIEIWQAPLDMYYATLNFASPESQLLNAALVQLVHDCLRLPCNTSPNTSSKTTDIQAAYEIALNVVFQFLTGVDIWTNYSFNDQAYNPETLILNHELYGYMKQLSHRHGDLIPIEENIAFQAIKEVGTGGDYLTHPITINNVKLLYRPRLADYRTLYAWMKDKTSMLDRIRAKVKEIDEYEPPPLPNEVVEKMNHIVKEADKKLGRV